MIALFMGTMRKATSLNGSPRLSTTLSTAIVEKSYTVYIDKSKAALCKQNLSAVFARQTRGCDTAFFAVQGLPPMQCVS